MSLLRLLMSKHADNDASQVSHEIDTNMAEEGPNHASSMNKQGQGERLLACHRHPHDIQLHHHNSMDTSIGVHNIASTSAGHTLLLGYSSM